MGINYESQVIGSVRVTGIDGEQGLGASQLRFVLAWNLLPKGVDTITIFGTSIWVSVMASGESVPAILGQAVPETAWCEETRDGHPFDRHLMYRLSLPGSQLLAIEQMRQGRGLVFTLEVRGNSHGPQGIRTFSDTTQMPVNVSEWVRVLKEANGADVLLVGVHLPMNGAGTILRAPIDLVRRANEHLVLGHYSAAVADCRLAIESVWKSAGLTDEAREARKLLSNMGGQLSMSKRDRELALGEAVRIFCHTAHHVGADAEPEIFSRLDAALAVSTTAALVSSMVANPDLAAPPKKSVNAVPTEKPDSPSLVPETNKPESTSLASQIAKVREHLKNNPKNRPGTLKKLRSVLESLFAKKLDSAALDRLEKELIKQKVVTETAGKLSYGTKG